MMLFGVVKKNSILQVDYTNTLREQGMERHEALIVGEPRAPAADPDDDDRDRRRHDPDRVRQGRRRRLARVDGGHDLGGQVLCLLLTLLVTPVVYSYFDDLREWSPTASVRRLLGRTPKTPTPAAERL